MKTEHSRKNFSIEKYFKIITAMRLHKDENELGVFCEEKHFTALLTKHVERNSHHRFSFHGVL